MTKTVDSSRRRCPPRFSRTKRDSSFITFRRISSEQKKKRCTSQREKSIKFALKMAGSPSSLLQNTRRRRTVIFTSRILSCGEFFQMIFRQKLPARQPTVYFTLQLKRINLISRDRRFRVKTQCKLLVFGIGAEAADLFT